MRWNSWKPPHSRPSIYQPIADHLAARTENEVVLTFAEIEALIARPLSISAEVSSHWWSARGGAQTRAWRALGWLAQLDRRNRCVHFTRDAAGLSPDG